MDYDNIENEIFKYIADINPVEIASQISHDTLGKWIKAWKYSFQCSIHRQFIEFIKKNKWISVRAEKPEHDEVVYLLYIDGNSIHTAFGYRFLKVDGMIDCYAFSNSMLVNGKVIAWKPLDISLTVEGLKEAGLATDEDFQL